MSDIQLDSEEKELLDSYDAGEWQPVRDLQDQMQKYNEAAAAAFKKVRA